MAKFPPLDRQGFPTLRDRVWCTMDRLNRPVIVSDYLFNDGWRLLGPGLPRSGEKYATWEEARDMLIEYYDV